MFAEFRQLGPGVLLHVSKQVFFFPGVADEHALGPAGAMKDVYHYLAGQNTLVLDTDVYPPLLVFTEGIMRLGVALADLSHQHKLVVNINLFEQNINGRAAILAACAL